MPRAARERHRALVTNNTAVLRQSIYYPYSWALKYMKGRVLDLRVESESYPIRAAGLQADVARNDQVPFVRHRRDGRRREWSGCGADAES
jgi:hypothetical protein